MNGLPHGPAGRLLASGISVALLLVLAFGVIAPGWDWYRERVELRDQREAFARRMTALVAGLPGQRAAFAERNRGAPPALLAGATDAIAAATLLSQVQEIARQSQAGIGSIETLPSEAVPGTTGAGALRRVGVRVSVDARWDALIALLATCAAATPRMVLDDLRVAAVAAPGGEPARFDATFNVIALRAAAGRPGTP